MVFKQMMLNEQMPLAVAIYFVEFSRRYYVDFKSYQLNYNKSI